jgi:hypothetical protein
MHTFFQEILVTELVTETFIVLLHISWYCNGTMCVMLKDVTIGTILCT